MAVTERKISELTDATSLNDSDLLMVTQTDRAQKLQKNSTLSRLVTYLTDKLKSVFFVKSNNTSNTVTGYTSFLNPVTVDSSAASHVILKKEGEFNNQQPESPTYNSIVFTDQNGNVESVISTVHQVDDNAISLKMSTTQKENSNSDGSWIYLMQYDNNSTRLIAHASNMYIGDSQNESINFTGSAINLYSNNAKVTNPGNISSVRTVDKISTTKWTYDNFSLNTHTHKLEDFTGYVAGDKYIARSSLVYYVNPETGIDKTDDNYGTTYLKPFKTIQYAVTQANQYRLLGRGCIYIRLTYSGIYDQTVYENGNPVGFTTLTFYHPDMRGNQTFYITNTWSEPDPNNNGKYISKVSNPIIKFNTAYEGDETHKISDFRVCINCDCNVSFSGIEFEGCVPVLEESGNADAWKKTYSGKKTSTMIQSTWGKVILDSCSIRNIKRGIIGFFMAYDCYFDNISIAMNPGAHIGLYPSMMTGATTFNNVYQGVICRFGSAFRFVLNGGKFDFKNCHQVASVSENCQINFEFTLSENWTSDTSTEDPYDGTLKEGIKVLHNSVKGQTLTYSKFISTLFRTTPDKLQTFTGSLNMQFGNNYNFLSLVTESTITAD